MQLKALKNRDSMVKYLALPRSPWVCANVAGCWALLKVLTVLPAVLTDWAFDPPFQ
jgi:hypothetical protein